MTAGVDRVVVDWQWLRGEWSADWQPIRGRAGARAVASRRCQMRLRPACLGSSCVRNRRALIIEPALRLKESPPRPPHTEYCPRSPARALLLLATTHSARLHSLDAPDGPSSRPIAADPIADRQALSERRRVHASRITLHAACLQHQHHTYTLRTAQPALCNRVASDSAFAVSKHTVLLLLFAAPSKHQQSLAHRLSL